MKYIAVLLTCHNRKEKTLSCLNSFFNSVKSLILKIEFDIYLVDDGSTDGTYEKIHTDFPSVNIITGNGNLFWARGMRLAWQTALSSGKDYDSFLLLNDDVVLLDNVFDYLLKTHEYCVTKKHQTGIYVCSTTEGANSIISYGGLLIKKKGIKINKSLMAPSYIPLECSMANANILLVTSEVVKKIGIFDPKFVHQFADYDYTLKASTNGIPVLLCPGIGGQCTDDHGKGWLTSKVSLKKRINYLYSPKGLGYREQVYYLKKNFKFQFPYYFVMLWLKTFFPFFWDKFKKNSGKIPISIKEK